MVFQMHWSEFKKCGWICLNLKEKNLTSCTLVNGSLPRLKALGFGSIFILNLDFPDINCSNGSIQIFENMLQLCFCMLRMYFKKKSQMFEPQSVYFSSGKHVPCFSTMICLPGGEICIVVKGIFFSSPSSSSKSKYTDKPSEVQSASFLHYSEAKFGKNVMLDRIRNYSFETDLKLQTYFKIISEIICHFQYSI